MAYGQKYLCEFDPIKNNLFTPVYAIDIYQKDYTGPTLRILGGSSAAIHNWDKDEIKPAVKGSSLKMNFVNEGWLPIETFYGEDDTFKVRLRWGSQVLFEGFMVQDDFIEPFIDWAHELTVSATDNLGLLKDVSFNDAPARFSVLYCSHEDYQITQSGLDTIVITSAAIGSTLQVGDRMTIDGIGPYDIWQLIPGLGLMNVYIIQNPAPIISNGLICFYRRIELDKTTLLNIVQICLSATGLELGVNIYANIYEQFQVALADFLSLTLVDVQTFIKSDNGDYDDCYTVLEKICGRFNLTLFQAKGVWNIVRWDELRYYDNKPKGWSYDTAGTLTTTELPSLFYAGIGQQTVAEYELNKRPERPLVYDKETFNYKQPSQLLRNWNLQQLGKLKSSYTTGSGANLHYVNEYEMPWWFYTDAFPTASGVNGPAVFYIRVVQDASFNEIERVVVLLHNSIHSYKVEASAGDSFKFSYSARTADAQAIGTIVNIIQLTNGTTTYYAKDLAASGQAVPGWGLGLGFSVTVSTPDSSQWFTVTVESSQVPFDGLLYFYLPVLSTNTNHETFFTDIRLEYIAQINQSTKITGHTHQNTQQAQIKNRDEKEIFIDNSPRNSIAGTLYLPTFTGLLQTRCNLWRRATVSEFRKLGDITTFETLFHRRITRLIFEGTFIGLVHENLYEVNIEVTDNGNGTQDVTFTWSSTPQLPAVTLTAVTLGYYDGLVWHNSTGSAVSPRTISSIPLGPYPYRLEFELSDGTSIITNVNFDGTVGDHVSMLSVFKYDKPGPINLLNFIFGKLEIDYRNNKFTGTLWEEWRDGEIDTDLKSSYQFKYLYAPK